MSTASDVCIPLEILREFILQSSPSPSTLAAWCSVSRSLLSFAGPLLYRSVALKRSEDVIPFLKRLRLARSSSPTPPSSSLLLPFVKGIQRLEIFAIPDWRDLLNFTNRRFTTQSRADLVLVVNWEGQIEEQMGSFFVPRLLLEILPTSYEEIGKKYNASK
ncbi:hypothetical protein BDY24DRAFT_72720 [Mrakia frigida]|uniref:uncharacterized protein n=1 Tax=Mrakia frigida TaxID=29902 RepID=UPI003FCC0D68